MTVRADRIEPDWLHLPSVPESALPDPLRRRLAGGEGGPPATPPWDTTVQAVLWWHRAMPAAADLLPAGMGDLPTLPVTVVALVRYLDSPVGSYSEVFASPVLLRPGPRVGALPAVSVPFIAVDSIASVVGGRAGWALPKSLAGADWPGSGRIELAGRAPDDEPWSVRATALPIGPALPVAGLLPLLQVQPDGSRRRSTVRMRGRGRLARVEVDIAGPTLPTWLRPGRHLGLQIDSGRMRISAPGPTRTGPA